MTPSPRCAALIKSFEQCRLTAYMPTPHDKWTCGWGATGEDIGPATQWTQPQADARFLSDLGEFGEGVSLRIGLGAPTTQDQFDAMVSLAYNIGLSNFAMSSLLRDHRAGRYVAASGEFARWRFQNGEVLDGLVRRREAETALYRGHQ